MAKNRWSYSVCNLTSQRILSGCVSVYLHTNFIFVPSVCVCVCVGCWVKPLIEKQATVATCLTVSPSICLEQHGASVRKGGRGSEAGGSDGEPASLHLCFLSLSLSFLLIWEATLELKKTLSLSLSLSPPSPSPVSVWVFFCLPSSASQRRVISQHDVLCCEFSTRHASSPPLPLHRHNFFEAHCGALSK